MCIGDIYWIERLGLLSMVGTALLVFALLWSHRRFKVSAKSIAVQLICLCAHPFFWLSAEQDCGEQLKNSSALFFGLALISFVWTHYRMRFNEQMPSKEHQ